MLFKSYVNEVDRLFPDLDQTETGAFILALIDLCLGLTVSRAR